MAARCCRGSSRRASRSNPASTNVEMSPSGKLTIVVEAVPTKIAFGGRDGSCRDDNAVSTEYVRRNIEFRCPVSISSLRPILQLAPRDMSSFEVSPQLKKMVGEETPPTTQLNSRGVPWFFSFFFRCFTRGWEAAPTREQLQPFSVGTCRHLVLPPHTSALIGQRATCPDLFQLAPVGTLVKGMPLSARGSCGNPSTRSAMMLAMISSVPPAMRSPGEDI